MNKQRSHILLLSFPSTKRRKEAIARNEKHRMKYVNQAKELKLGPEETTAFVNHKIGVPKKKEKKEILL